MVIFDCSSNCKEIRTGCLHHALLVIDCDKMQSLVTVRVDSDSKLINSNRYSKLYQQLLFMFSLVTVPRCETATTLPMFQIQSTFLLLSDGAAGTKR